MNKKLLWLLSLLALFLQAKAQQNKITINVSSTPVEEVLKLLTDNYGYQFAYSSNQVNIKKRVSIKVTDETIENTLRLLFTGLPVGYSASDKNVVLFYSSKYNATLSGYLREKGTGELLIGAVVNSQPLVAGAMSNAYGFYSLTLPADTYTFCFNYIGYKPVSQTVNLLQSQSLNIELEAVTSLNEVTVSAQHDKPHMKLNSIDIPLAEIKEVPAFLGEKDVVKYTMLSSGVQKGNEGNSYIYVRGGGPDQNLILIDDAVIYNAYHFLGLSSLFSGNELRKAELIKGGFSSRYGGRLSSVLDMSMKDGNRERFSAEATAGIISSRIMIEAPIVKNKSSFLISARKSYIDQVGKWLIKEDGSSLNYKYYDVHAKVSTNLGRRDRLMLSGYVGNDLFGMESYPGTKAADDGISWGNKAASLRWNHQFNSKLFLNTSAIYSYYKTRTAFAGFDYNSGEQSSTSVQSTINDYTLKADLDYSMNTKHQFKAGCGFTRHYFNPITQFRNYTNNDLTRIEQNFFTSESYAYFEWVYKPADRWTIISGGRYTTYKYQTAYHRFEPRITVQYNAGKNWTALASYSLMNQYMHLLSAFSGINFPNDAWISSDENLKPQRAHIYTLGLSKNSLFGKNIVLNIEAYHKDIENAVSMKEGYTLFNILPVYPFAERVNNWSEIATQGTGESNGIELSVKKEGTRFDFWLSYTLSKTTFQFDEINLGRRYRASFDRTHDIGAYIGYKASKHFTLSASWVYGTGNAISLPVGEYYAISHQPGYGLTPKQPRYDYEQKNNYRMKAYHRLDASVQYRHNIAPALQSIIELSVYNAYNRANAFYYQIEPDKQGTGKRSLQQLSIFPVMPALSWTIKF